MFTQFVKCNKRDEKDFYVCRDETIGLIKSGNCMQLRIIKLHNVVVNFSV